MSEEEKRAVRASALLEFEEAKAALALLRAKAEQWSILYEKATGLLRCARREAGYREQTAVELRMEVAARRSEFAAALDLEVVFALDNELQAALVRFRRAEDAKRELGFV